MNMMLLMVTWLCQLDSEMGANLDIQFVVWEDVDKDLCDFDLLICWIVITLFVVIILVFVTFQDIDSNYYNVVFWY